MSRIIFLASQLQTNQDETCYQKVLPIRSIELVNTILGFLCSKISICKLSVRMSMFQYWVFLYGHISNWLNKLKNSFNDKMKIIIFIYKQIPDSTVFLKPIDTNYKIKVRSYRTVNFLSSMNVLHIYPSCNYTKEYKTIMCLHDLFA